jgi:hypothetical protein
MRSFYRRLGYTLAASLAIAGVGPARSDTVTDWNLVAKTAIVNNAGKPPTTGSAVLAYMHGAIYDAVQAIEGQYTPYAYVPAALDPSASREAAVVSAGYHVLSAVFPGQSAFLDGARLNSLAAIPDGDSKDRGLAIGAAAAAAMLANRANDGFEAPVAFVPGSGPGVWQPTPPAFLPALSPWMAQLRPFSMTSPEQFRADGPPALGSAQWVEDYNEIKAYGAAVGSLRTAAQTELGRFWIEHPVAQYTRMWRELASAQGLSTSENARFFAMLSFSWADALVASFESKYHFQFWRPVTAIRAGDSDGNAGTAPDAAWSSAQPTPNHPEYPAAHSASAAAQATVIEEFFGTKKVPIPLSSAVTGTAYVVGSTDDFVKELIEARIMGGMHYRTSGVHGAVMGRKVGGWLARQYFQPVVR